MQEKPKIGDIAPDFELKDQDGKTVKLSDFRGKKVLLSFHPLAFTEVCKGQMQQLDSLVDELEKLNTVAFGISVDAVPTKKAWAQQMGIKKLRMLSDFWPHGEVARKYGVFREKDGFSERANIIVDEEGKIIFYKVYELRLLPDFNEILNFLRG